MLKWIGHIQGIECWYTIPARDLTAKEVRQHGGEKALLATGLYEKSQSGASVTPSDDSASLFDYPVNESSKEIADDE